MLISESVVSVILSVGEIKIGNWKMRIRNYCLISLSVAVGVLFGCSNEPPVHIAENHGIDTKVDFSLLINAYSTVAETTYLRAEGIYDKEDVRHELELPISESTCPARYGVTLKSGVLSYRIAYTDMKQFEKDRADECVAYYTKRAVEVIALAAAKQRANVASYKDQ